MLTRPSPRNLAGSTTNRFENVFMILAMFLMVSSVFSRFELTLGVLTPRIEHIVIVGVAPVFLLVLWLRDRSLPKIDVVWIALGVWIAANLLASTVNAPSPKQSLVQVVRLALLPAVYGMVSLTVRRMKMGITLVKTWIALGVSEAVYGIAATISAYASGTTFGVQRIPVASWPRPYGTMIEANIFASFLGCIFVTILASMLWQRKTGRVFLFPNNCLYSGLFLVSVALVLSTTRAAWVAIAVVGIGIFVRFHSGWRQSLVFGFAVVLPFIIGIGILFSLVSIAQRNSGVTGPDAAETGPGTSSTGDANSGANFGGAVRLQGSASTSTVAGRTQDWSLAFHDWLDHPWIGNGTGSFGQIHGSIRGGSAWISNWVLHALVDSGLLGLGGLTAGVLIVCYRAIRVLSVGGQTVQSAALLGLGTGLTVLLIAYIFTDAIWFASFWIQLGLLAAFAALQQQAPVRWHDPTSEEAKLSTP